MADEQNNFSRAGERLAAGALPRVRDIIIGIRICFGAADNAIEPRTYARG
jgi:hypothetical protein